MPSPPRAIRTWVLAALVLGAAISASALWRGSPVEQTVRTLAGEEARVVLRVENLGTHDVVAQLDVTKANGGRLFADEWSVPAGGSQERVLAGRLSGEFIAQGRFEWSEPPRRGTGNYGQMFESNECPWGDAIVVTFAVDTTNGISFPEGQSVTCRAR